MFLLTKKLLLTFCINLLTLNNATLDSQVQISNHSFNFKSRLKNLIDRGNKSDSIDVSRTKDIKLSWKRYDFTKKSGFSVEFPMDPDHSGQIIELPQSDISIKYDTYVAEPHENVVFVVSAWEYPEKIDVSKPELNLQDGFSGMINALPESHVIFLQSTSIQNNKALEFWICNDNVYFRGMLISVKHTLYQVFMVYKSSDAKSMDREYESFIKSFKITNVRESKFIPSPSNKKIYL